MHLRAAKVEGPSSLLNQLRRDHGAMRCEEKETKREVLPA